MKKGSFAGVDVFSSLVVFAKDASAEADDIAVIIMDGESELIIPAGVDSGSGVLVIAHASETSLDEFTSGEALLSDELKVFG